MQGGGRSPKQQNRSASKAAPAKDERQPKPPEPPKIGHKAFLGGIGDLTEEEIRNYFSPFGQVVGLDFPSKRKEGQPPGKAGFCFITFQKTEVVEKLTQTRYFQVGNRRVELKPVSEPDPTSFWSARNALDEDILNQLETGPKAPKTIVTTEDRKEEQILSPGEGSTWNVIVWNKGGQSRVLFGADCVPKPRDLIIQDNIKRGRELEGYKELRASQQHFIKVIFKPQAPYRYGILRWLLVVRGRNLNISHELRVVVANKQEMELLKPDSEYKPKDRIVDDVVRTVVPAFPPSRASKNHLHTPVETNWVEPLDLYEIPEDLQRDIDTHHRYGKFDPWLIKDNYRKRLHTLLWIEEAQQKFNLRKFDLVNAKLEPVVSYKVNEVLHFPDQEDPLARLYIPGLAEARPSVLKGDVVYAWLPGTTDYEYEGFVHSVEQHHVLVMFCKDFHERITESSVYNIRFSFHRLMMRLMHRAVDKCDISLVWPEEKAPSGSLSLSLSSTKPGEANGSKGKEKENKGATRAHPFVDAKQVRWYDASVSENSEQATAVVRLVNKQQTPEDGSAPILMFGAFGTGKTRTLVEAIKQILTHHPPETTRILVCAPSNSAADVFIERLSGFLRPQEMFRLNAFHRAFTSREVLAHSLYDPNLKIYNIPPLEALLKYRVIVSTSHSSGNLYGVGIRRGHFTHIVLDEAAQMMEAEALIPLSIADEKCVIIMAGDDKQLGPHVQSPSCRVHGLGKSIMERIAALPVYQSGKNLCLGLTRNYRSHPALLEFSSRMFYKGELKCQADRGIVNSLCGWRRLQNPKFPFMFVGVEGQDMREGDSPSFFNPIELIQIADLIEDLLDDKPNLRPKDIGVITPFHKQTTKCRTLLRQRGLRDVMVGSVQEMQGKEKKAIFLTTVRATNHWKEHDRTYDLGFLNNEKRLNTSLTRAQALVVTVGDPYVLYNDKHWKELIMYCHQNNSYIGPELRPEYLQQRSLREQKEAALYKNALVTPSEAPLIATEIDIDDDPGFLDEIGEQDSEKVRERIPAQKEKKQLKGDENPRTIQLEDVWNANMPKLKPSLNKPTEQQTAPAPTSTATSLQAATGASQQPTTKTTAPPTKAPQPQTSPGTSKLNLSVKPYYPKQKAAPSPPTPTSEAQGIPKEVKGDMMPLAQQRPQTTAVTRPAVQPQKPLGAWGRPLDASSAPPILQPAPPQPKAPKQPQREPTPVPVSTQPLKSTPQPQPPPQQPMAPMPPPSFLPPIDPQQMFQQMMHMQLQIQQLYQQSQLQQQQYTLQLRMLSQAHHAQQPMPPVEDVLPATTEQPLPHYTTGHPANHLPPEAERDKYFCVFKYLDVQLISAQTDLSCPPMTVYETPTGLAIHIPLFGLQWKMKHQDRLLHLGLHSNYEQLKDAAFHISALHTPQGSYLSMNENRRERCKKNAKLLIAVPPTFDEESLRLDERESVLVISMARSLPPPLVVEDPTTTMAVMQQPPPPLASHLPMPTLMGKQKLNPVPLASPQLYPPGLAQTNGK